MSVTDRQRRDGSAVPDRTVADGTTEMTVNASAYWLFVSPSGRGNGFRASVRGHTLELADPDSKHGLAPTPEDLRIAAIASDVAWFSRGFLVDLGFDGYVSVSALSKTSQGSLDIRVEVSKDAVVAEALLFAALERRFGAHLSSPPTFQVCGA